ncbi:MAG: VWA domain-containing protein [Gammaproteobacteria bacterium]|nr:VWA domain-containing protein [Gammaproteobacteria bacterium]
MSRARSYKPLVISLFAMLVTSAVQPALATQQVAIPKIQMAIILDTSNSMDGLIDQTRNQLWQVINEFSAARQQGMTPVLEIALYEYGNDSNSIRAGYVRKLSGFTSELDAVSEGLFSLTTNGGSEFSGFAIQTAVNNLQWSQSDSDIKTIFIAGNEAFTQGPVDYRKAINLAGHHGITINTIHAGNHQEGINHSWQAGAILAGGDYMSIDTDQQVVHIVAPQDKQIVELNARLNETYVPYGDQGKKKIQRQVQQDAYSSGISAGLLAKRAESKTSSFYRNSKWDLVDAIEEGEVDAKTLAQLEDAALPAPMKGLSSKQKLIYVKQKAAERETIKQQIAELSHSRSAYVAEKKLEQAAAAPSVGDALSQAVKKQAGRKGFVFE